MAARKKPEHLKLSGAKIPVWVPLTLKADIDAMAEDTDKPTSQRVRELLEAEVKKWKQAKKS